MLQALVSFPHPHWQEAGTAIAYLVDDTTMNPRELLGLLVTVAVCFAVAGVGGLFTATSVETWYPGLQKPPWSPPRAVFGPVWITLYIMMAVAAWRVWQVDGLVGARRALALFSIQLALNLAWSGLFFGLRRPDLALIEIVILWLAIGATMMEFYRHSRGAAILLVPYALWVGYAVSLNAAIWYLNR